jgi:hypothetical protein
MIDGIEDGARRVDPSGLPSSVAVLTIDPVERYLSKKEVAEMIGVLPATLSRYKFPEPDAIIGDVRGWLPETVEAWNAVRPGRGRWSTRD